MKQKIATIFFLSICFTINAQQNIDFEQKVDSLLLNYHNAGHFNGNILISEKGNIVYHKSYGLSNFADSTLLDTNAIFNIASISKIFSSAAIIVLEKQGRLSLEDRITKYITELPEMYNQVTIRHLLTHTAGIPADKRGWQARIDTENADVLEFLKQQTKLDFKPGNRYKYSNYGFILLAIIVEKVSGNKFDDFVEQNLFIPANMNNSFIRAKNLKSKTEKIVCSYINNNQADWPLYTYGAGGVYSTTYDLYLWDKAFFSYSIFDSITTKKILTPVTVENKEKNYGLGWGILKTNKEIFVGHTGGMFGFRTIYEHCLNKNVSIIILTNIGDSSPTMEIRNKIDILINNFLNTE